MHHQFGRQNAVVYIYNVYTGSKTMIFGQA